MISNIFQQIKDLIIFTGNYYYFLFLYYFTFNLKFYFIFFFKRLPFTNIQTCGGKSMSRFGHLFFDFVVRNYMQYSTIFSIIFGIYFFKLLSKKKIFVISTIVFSLFLINYYGKQFFFIFF